jgi:hypothetical protein
VEAENVVSHVCSTNRCAEVRRLGKGQSFGVTGTCHCGGWVVLMFLGGLDFWD